MTYKIVTFAGKAYSAELVPSAGGVQPIPMDGLNGSQLLELYNLVSSNLGRGRVKRFADTKTAIKRTWGILQEYAAQPDEDFEMGEEELAAQKERGLVRPSGEPVVDTKGPVSILDEADKKQIVDEAAARKPHPAATASEALIKVVSEQAARTQAQTALRNNPPASDNPAKDAEMPALRKALRPVELAPKKKVYARKAGSKQAVLVDLLSRPGGATFGELYDGLAATGKPWKGVTIRSGLAWDINHIAGYGVSSELLNGEEFQKQRRLYEANRLGVGTDGYDPALRLAVYRLVYPAGMTEPLPHTGKKA